MQESGKVSAQEGAAGTKARWGPGTSGGARAAGDGCGRARVSQGQQELLGSKRLWRLNGHLGLSPGQVCFSVP